MDQDARFSNKEKKLIGTMKFPPEYATKVDMHKVELEVIKPWIAEQITDLLKFEDEVLIGYVYGLLEEKQFPDPRLLQIRITGFLEQDSSQFCLNLWKILISAQNSLGGVPPQFMQRKKQELLQRKAEMERIRAGIAKKSGALEGVKEEEKAPKVDEEAQKKQAETAIEKLNKKYKDASSDDDDWHSRKLKKRSSSRSRSRSPKDRRDSRRRDDRRDSRDDRYRNKRSRRSPSDERRRDRRDNRDYRRRDRSDSRDRRGRSSSRERRRRDESDSRSKRNRSDSRDKRGRSTSRDKRRSTSGDRKGKSSSRSSSRSKSPVKDASPSKEKTDSYEQALREKALASMKDKKQ